MKQTKKRREVITLVKPPVTQDFIPIAQADAELRHIAIVFYLAGLLTWLIILPPIGALFF